jgi:ankyrin repeat protein
MAADALVRALKNGTISEVRAAVRSNPDAARHPRAIGEAARRGTLSGLQLLVKHGADVNAIFRGYRPLHSVIQEDAHQALTKVPSERLECLKWLLANGADPELPAAWPPARALIVAAFTGVPEYVELLLAAGARVDPFISAALGDAIRVTPDLARGRDPHGLTALQCAAGSRLPSEEARRETAQLLLDAGADAHAKTKSWNHDVDALYFAASARNHSIFRLLLERGADANAALTHGAWGDLRFAETALEFGAQPDEATADRQPLLNNLIRWGQLQPAFWLLSKGASPNLPDERGWTALHQAVSRGNERMVRALLDAGADASRLNVDGDSPAQMAEDLHRGKLKALFS